jgi:SAM-dependent methyltransferase
LKRSHPYRNPFDDSRVATGYEQWYSTAGKQADGEEKHVLRELLRDFADARTVLEVGCGTGHFARWLGSLGLNVVGLDVSAAMLAEARQRRSPPCIRSDALALPFQSRAFDVVALLTTLEFVQDPAGVLIEAARVAKAGLLLGFLNRWSLLGLRRRLSRRPLWRTARLFSPPELRQLIRQSMGGRMEEWRWGFALSPAPGVTRLLPACAGFLGVGVRLANQT